MNEGRMGGWKDGWKERIEEGRMEGSKQECRKYKIFYHHINSDSRIKSLPVTINGSTICLPFLLQTFHYLFLFYHLFFYIFILSFVKISICTDTSTYILTDNIFKSYNS